MAIFALIYKIITTILSAIRYYVLEVIVLMFIVLFSLWALAFIGNGLYGCNFDLQSCWGGFSAIGGAGVLAIAKYCTDSWKNSEHGVMPSDFVTKLDLNHDGKVDSEDIAYAIQHKNEQYENTEGTRGL